MTDTVLVEGISFKTVLLPTANSVILLIQGQKANLGCGYFSMAAAEKMQDRFAIVRGVSTIDEVLNAPVADLSPEAAKCGVSVGMPGREALLLMEKTA
ncbi:MAG: DUF1805 domain-containing protein [Lentisphaerae bacterium]|nr:DUF1805 domain-containing protein [Lentisphaerota bacterium]